MRTTLTALLCSFAAACAPIGGGGPDREGPDAGVDAGSASATCDSYETKTMDITVSSAPGSSAYSNLPSKCWKLNGKLTVSGQLVTSLADLKDLREVTELVIENTKLTKIDTMGTVTVSGAVTLTNNAQLTDIAKLEAAPTLASLTIANNDALQTVGGLVKVGTVNGLTKVIDNDKLATLNLGTVSRLEGGVTIQNNATLNTIDLHSVTSTGAVDVSDNGSLTGLQMTALQYVHGNITINNNDKLQSLAGIAAGINVAAPYAVWVTNNATLTNIQSIARASFIYGAVTINLNPQLTYTSAHEVYCCADTGPVNIGGTINQGNCGGNHYCSQCVPR